MGRPWGKPGASLWAVPGLHLLVQGEGKEKQVWLVWPDLEVWMSSQHWRTTEGICVGRGCVWRHRGPYRGLDICPGRRASSLDQMGTEWADLGGVSATAGAGFDGQMMG